MLVGAEAGIREAGRETGTEESRWGGDEGRQTEPDGDGGRQASEIGKGGESRVIAGCCNVFVVVPV